MAKELRDVVKARKRHDAQFEQEQIWTRGTIVARNGSTAVPGIENHIWVQPMGTGEPVAVYNRQVKGNREEMGVWIGFAPRSDVLEVLRGDISSLAGFTDTAGLEIQAHAASHLPGGDDPLYVYPRAVVMLLCYPGSGLSVQVSPYSYLQNGQFVRFNGSVNFSLSSHLPAGGLARFVLVGLNVQTNALVSVAGDTVTNSLAITPPFPTIPADVVASAFVRLASGQTSFAETDFVDARDFLDKGLVLDDKKLSVSGADTTFNYLTDKLEVDYGLTKTIVNPGGDEFLLIESFFNDSISVNVPAGFASISAALVNFRSKVVRNCVINVDADTYTESLTIEQTIPLDGNEHLVIVGDDRDLAGHCWVDGVDIPSLVTGAGAGTCSLSNSGTTITVTGSTTNPDFSGWGSGDKVLIVNNSGTLAEFTISSVSGNVITLTATAPTVGNTGTAIALMPDRIINPASVAITVETSGIRLKGFRIVPTTNAVCVNIATGFNAHSAIFIENCAMSTGGSQSAIVNNNMGFISVARCVFYSSGGMIRASSQARIELNRSVGLLMTGNAVDAFFGGQIGAANCIVTGSGGSSIGYVGRIGGVVSVSPCVAIGCTIGYNSEGGIVYAVSSTAINNTTGYRASNNGYTNAASTNANNSGNTTNYSPATSGTEGNQSGLIIHS